MHYAMKLANVYCGMHNNYIFCSHTTKGNVYIMAVVEGAWGDLNSPKWLQP